MQCFKSREDNYVPTVQYQKILIYFVCVTTSYNQQKQHESPSSEVDQAKSPYDLERRMQLQRMCARCNLTSLFNYLITLIPARVPTLEAAEIKLLLW